MSWLATNFISAFLLPPLCFLLLLGLGIVYFHRRPKVARFILIALFGLLYLGSTPYCTDAALHLLEGRNAALHPPYAQVDAIVILGGGSNFDAPEYEGRDTVSYMTLQRIRYGASLQRATGEPILVSGGKPLGGKRGEAVQMRDVLEQEFHVPVRWVEDDSNNTFENARNSYQMLHAQGIQRIYLVTHSWHMPRAVRAFEDAGFKVIAAPTAFTTGEHLGPMAFLPRAESLRDSKIFMHELIGLLWYRIKSATN
ncbi:MAG: YdcF family protein [Gallionella sp.]|nr:YdcF family protein [Gallionella sp.]